MRVFFVLSALIGVTIAQLIDGGFNTRLDHFNQLDNRMVHFRYQINLDYYSAGGPLFFYINNVVYVTEWTQRGLMVDVARATNGALITTTQRYYGLNQPTDDVTFENLQYLSSDQMTTDIAYLIQDVKRHLASPNARVILWGSGFGATTAIWARQNFPFLIDGAWLSSGLFRPVVFSTEYYDHLENVIHEYGGEECSENLRFAFREVHNRVVNGDLEDLINNFALCEPWNINSTMDVGLLFQGLVNIIEENIHTNHLAGITNICNNLTATPNDPYTSFGDWVRLDQQAYLGRCLNYDFTGLLAQLRETFWEAPGVTTGLRQLLFAICTNGGALHTTHQTSIFANHISQFFHYSRCTETFAGTNYQFERLYNANMARRIKFGSANPNVSRVIITNGELDPFIKFSITEYNATDSLLFNFPGYGRSADLDEILPTDSEILASAKREIFDKLVEWATGS